MEPPLLQLVKSTASGASPFEENGAIWNASRQHVQVGSTLYALTSLISIQRAELVGQQWLVEDDASYKLSTARGLLPAEARSCSDGGPRFCDCPQGTDVDASCIDAIHCAIDQMCIPRPELGGDDRRNLEVGGSPASLWTASFHLFKASPFPKSNLYLIRVPIETEVPGGDVSGPIGGTWSGERLWLFRENAGTYSFRIRDDGLWSSWVPLPVNVDLADGIAALSGGASVELFARGEDGMIYRSSLISAIECAAASCTWAPWEALPVPGSILASTAPAAAYQGATAPFLVVRHAIDGTLHYTRRVAGVWAPWRLLAGTITDSAPAVTYNPVDSHFWIAAREAARGRIRVMRINPTLAGGPPTPWRNVGGKSSLRRWTRPAVTFEGNVDSWRVRVLAATPVDGDRVYQAVSTGGRFRSFKKLTSRTRSDGEIFGVVVNGDMNLLAVRDGQLVTSLVK